MVVFCSSYALILPAVTMEKTGYGSIFVELTGEEQTKVDEVVTLIDILPTQGKIEKTLAGFADAGDEDGYDAYLTEIITQVREAYDVYSALTEAQQEKVANAVKLMALEPFWSMQALEDLPAVTGDEAYVTDISITNIVDGTAPWDDNDNAGNDSSEQNRIVRTFDTVTYNFAVQLASYEGASYSKARVKLEIVLPLTPEQAVFDQSAMAWMDQAAGYTPVLAAETRNIDGMDTQCQVLTCYKELLPIGGHLSVVPGSFGENVTINVKSMKNGDTFAPIFSACMEYGTWDGSCAEHKKAEKVTVEADKVTVSAAPKYNIQISGRSLYKSTFDFSSGNATAQSYGDGYNKGRVTGRALCLGVTLQLYNDNASKGFKGIEIPDGRPITFDLELSSGYHINDIAPPVGYSQGQDVNVTDAYMPLLWSCDGNRAGTSNSDGRILEDSWGGALNVAPYNSGKGATNCAQGGEWTAVQDRTTIHVTVSGYTINMDAMPTQNADGGAVKYGEALGIGCFSAGEVWIVQPYNRIGAASANEGPKFDVVSDYGQGTFVTRIQGMNLSATSISGQEVKDNDGTNSSQMKKDDDTYSPSVSLLLPGNIVNRVWYTDWNNTKVVWRDVNGQSDCFQNGQDALVTGSKARLVGGFTYESRNQEENLMCWGTNLLKFNAEAFDIDTTAEPTFTSTTVKDGQDSEAAMTVLYATKKDGTDWANDYELQHAYEDDLLFYGSVSEIPSGHKCIGALFCFKGGNVSTVKLKYIGSVPVKITDNTNLAGNTYMLVSTSRAWTQYMFDDAGMTLDELPDWTNSDTKLSDFPSGCYTSGNIEGSLWYNKEVYRSDGSGAEGKHNCSWAEWGDTLLLISCKTGITKAMPQKDSGSGSDKTTYYLDSEQRIADFKLQPRTYYDQGEKTYSLSTTVTITDTLSKYLTYVPGSCYFGGDYTQSSIHGGTQGGITGGTQREPDSVVNNADGTQTLTWVIPNVTVGAEMPVIWYSANIGNRNKPTEDVPTGTTNLTNTVRISATHDIRQPSLTNGNYAEVGLAVARGTAASYGKYSVQDVVDADGIIDYVVYYDNNGSADEMTPVLVDAMPVNGKGGSKFSGTWEITKFTISLVGVGGDASLADLDATLFWTFDEHYAGMTLTDLQKEQNSPYGVWQKEPVVDGDGPETLVGKTPVMWVLNGTSLPAGSELRVEYTVRLIPEPSSAIVYPQFANTFSTGKSTITTETPVVRRVLEGLTWLDESADGIQNEDDESRLSGVTVTLLKLKEGGDPTKESDYEPYHYQGDSTKPAVEIRTGQIVSVYANCSDEAKTYEPGRYKFTDLPAGIFAVRFTDGDTMISARIASPPNRGSDDSQDSDGIATYSADRSKLERSVILGIEMPKAEDLSVVLYESKHHDSGFYEKSHELPMTGGYGAIPYTIGGLLIINAGLLLLYQKCRKEGFVSF